MASDKLSVYEGRGGHGWSICWICDGEQGATVGDGLNVKDGPTRKVREFFVVHEAVRLADGCKSNSSGFYFESRAQAVAAKRAADFALRNLDMPMPAWALTAAAAGWKAPKGWKP